MEAASFPTSVALPTQNVGVLAVQHPGGNGVSKVHKDLPDEDSPLHYSGLYNTTMDAEQLNRKLKNYESITSSQMRNLEAKVEQMLHQATGSIHKDIAAREERLVRRIDAERSEQQTALLELRRDVTAQQTRDRNFTTCEERLSKRLDTERQHQKAAMLELRQEVGVQQEQQLASLRRDLGTTQAALSKLAQARSVAEEGRSQTPSTTTSEHSNTDASISDMRREMNDIRQSLQMQLNAAEGAMQALRRELVSHDDVRGLQEQFNRTHNEFARSMQDVIVVVEALSKGAAAPQVSVVREQQSPLREKAPLREKSLLRIRRVTHGAVSPAPRPRDVSPTRFGVPVQVCTASTAALSASASFVPPAGSPSGAKVQPPQPMMQMQPQDTPRRGGMLANTWMGVRR